MAGYHHSHAAVTPHNPGITRQRQLSDFLYAELLHTVGSYRLSRERFEELQADLTEHPLGKDDPLVASCDQGILCNKELQLHLHDPTTSRHPIPTGVRDRSETIDDSLPAFKPDLALLESVSNFYDVAIASLRLSKARQREEAGATTSNGDDYEPGPGEMLREILSVAHDPQRRARPDPLALDAQRRGRAMRMDDRRKAVSQILQAKGKKTPSARDRLASGRSNFASILEDHIQAPASLHLTIVEALSEAHRWMHVAEHLRAQSFGRMLASIPETYAKTQQMLRYSLALNTFVFVAARTIPWTFAEDAQERDKIIGDYKRSCDRLVPTYCMWIATQLSMLALHRRAFTYWTMGRHDRAYRDFHKLARLLRASKAPAEKRAVRVPGTKTFLEGMTAMSELHIGRIYRGQHANRMALKYFKRASRHLKRWETHDEIGHIIANSHWRISLLINEAKANYELGRVKRSLLFYARAWRAFLHLADSESHATANINAVEEFIEWLKPLVDEPHFSKVALGRQLAPLVEQFETLRSPKHLELLAADIIMRTGHLMYILKLPPIHWDPDNSAHGPPATEHDLAYRCVVSAAHMDPESTLVAADLLKIEADTSRKAGWAKSPSPVPIAAQWPAGSGRFEEAARIIEYTLQRWLAKVENDGDASSAEVTVARRLLASFLVHTDSSNLKLAQVYSYLMREPRATKRRTDPEQCTLDLICLRRYSSFFPFLPRPSAFGAPGGGYFVQTREPGARSQPFGIAVDPGPDFIENLYRCGFALSDIHMIALTHDHADHIASLDALLALLGNRAGLGDERFGRDGRRLAIVGNESVVRRYEFFDQGPPGRRSAERRDAVSLLDFEEIAEITRLSPKARRRHKKGKKILQMPDTLRIEPIRSYGHHDAHGHISQAFMLSMGDEDESRSSILFTGDTGLPPTENPASSATRFAKGSKELLDAVGEADVVVAHLSSVPLRELRQLAGLTEENQEPDVVPEFRKLWGDVRKQVEAKRTRDQDSLIGIEQAEFLLRQLQFGFRSRPADKNAEFAVSPFSPVETIKEQPEQHLYLSGLIEIARKMERGSGERATPPLLLIGELREELGAFRTRIANHISTAILRRDASERSPIALTADIGLRVRVARPTAESRARPVDPDAITVLCTTCDLDNDLVPTERFHRPHEILEVCVKGEDEGVFYNCKHHDPSHQPDVLWLEAVERYDVFGD
jgi:tetratricopeptide (TPR) repeat protein